MRQVKSFQIVMRENNRNELDGIFALITSPGSPLTASDMILAYREKYLIESAFREMKSILKLRPWFVYKDEHIRAHYTICVLAYLLEKILDLRLEEKALKAEGFTLGSIKEELKKYRLVEFALGEKHRRQVLQKIPDELGSVLKRLRLNTSLKPPVPVTART